MIMHSMKAAFPIIAPAKVCGGDLDDQVSIQFAILMM